MRAGSVKKEIVIGLVGDFDANVPAHQAIPLALQRAAGEVGCACAWEWVGTAEIKTAERVGEFDALWCVPASPYRWAEGALRAIRHAREAGVPFLGTCGGFQHAVLEYARNVLGWADALHAEEADPATGRAVIAPLACALVEAIGGLRLVPGTRLAAAYGVGEISEGYRCRFGLNPEFREALTAGPLRAAAFDPEGEVRAVELNGHPFFVGTLFQPERAALRNQPAPLVRAFLQAASS